MRATYDNCEPGTFLTKPGFPDEVAKVVEKENSRIRVRHLSGDGYPEKWFDADEFDRASFELEPESTQ